MKHPNRRKVELKQHTPLIHFQHGQEGATLRASDLKPKLDRYLFNKLPDYQKYLVGGGFADPDHQVLDYKVHIVAEGKIPSPIIKGDRSIPLFFANMGDDLEELGLVTHRRVSLEFHSFYPTLLDALELNIGTFFTCTNFGTRSTKGFGSFTVENDPAVPVNAYWFEINTRDWKVAFSTIELFYKSIRGGINGIQSPQGGFVRDFYMKPLLFSYARKKGIKWEKKIIKERWPFGNVLNAQQADRERSVNDQEKQDSPLWVAEPNDLIVRDLLGLSTYQNWRDLSSKRNATVTKEDTKKRIERFPSPLVFKPIQTSNGYRIYFWGDPIPTIYLNSAFIIKVNRQQIGQFNMWKEFDLQDFLKNFLNTHNAEAAMRYNPNDSRQKSVADTLLNIYSAIEKNRT